MFVEERFAQLPQTRIGESARPFADVIPIGRLLRAQIGRPLQQLRSFLRAQVAHLPFPRVEAELLVLQKLAAQLDEIRSLQRIARLEFRMIAPDPQRHPIAGIGESELAVRLLLARHFRSNTLDLDVNARLHGRTVLGVTAYFAQGQQFHQRKLTRHSEPSVPDFTLA